MLVPEYQLRASFKVENRNRSTGQVKSYPYEVGTDFNIFEKRSVCILETPCTKKTDLREHRGAQILVFMVWWPVGATAVLGEGTCIYYVLAGPVNHLFVHIRKLHFHFNNT